VTARWPRSTRHIDRWPDRPSDRRSNRGSRYPRGAFDLTCYDYEPWHYRYVGRALAAEIVASGLTPRQLLWTRQ